MMTNINIDMSCAKYGAEIGNIGELKESLVNKALGVLQEEGVYAFFLFLASRGNNENNQAKEIQKSIFRLLNDFQFFKKALSTEDKVLQDVRDKLAEDLDTLLLARDLIEHTLVYARYHRKTKEEN